MLFSSRSIGYGYTSGACKNIRVPITFVLIANCAIRRVSLWNLEFWNGRSLFYFATLRLQGFLIDCPDSFDGIAQSHLIHDSTNFSRRLLKGSLSPHDGEVTRNASIRSSRRVMIARDSGFLIERDSQRCLKLGFGTSGLALYHSRCTVPEQVHQVTSAIQNLDGSLNLCYRRYQSGSNLSQA